MHFYSPCFQPFSPGLPGQPADLGSVLEAVCGPRSSPLTPAQHPACLRAHRQCTGQGTLCLRAGVLKVTMATCLPRPGDRRGDDWQSEVTPRPAVLGDSSCSLLLPQARKDTPPGPRVRPGVLHPSQTSCRRWEGQSFSMSSGSRAGPGGGGPDPKSGQGFLRCRLPTSVTRSHRPSSLSPGKKEPGRFVKSSEQLQGKKGARQACLPGSQEPVLGLTSQHPAH